MGRSIKIEVPTGGFRPQARSRANGVVCGACPKFRDGFCAVMARFASRLAGACAYGRRLIRSKAVMDCKDRRCARGNV